MVPCHFTAKNWQLIEADGFRNAANLIGEAIQKRLSSKEGLLEDLEKMVEEYPSMNIKRIGGVAGSPRFAVYDIDFGLGKLQKRQFISIDETRSI